MSMDFLDPPGARLLIEIVERRRPSLVPRLRREGALSRSDVDELHSILLDEFLAHLDADWEPTAHGRVVSALMSSVNEARLREWP